MNKIEVAKQLRLNSETRLYHIPEFSGANIPLKKAAKIMNKDCQFVREGLIKGFLPIGMAYKQPDSSIYNFYISLENYKLLVNRGFPFYVKMAAEEGKF